MKAYIVARNALAENIRLLRAHAGNAAVYGVIKGNGYGLGLLRMARLLRENGVDRYAVTELSEIRTLRESGFDTEEILMLRATCLPEELSELLTLDATATVGSMECAEAMNRIALEQGKVFHCHVKMDTGMGRYGFHPSAIEEIIAAYKLPGLKVTGIYTHFHSAFCNADATKQQFQAFSTVCEKLTAAGIAPGLRHCCNSSAFLTYPEMHLDAVRIGSALLGRVACSDPLGLTRIGWCSAQVEVLRTIPAGHTVGYGAGWTAKRETRIAVCGIGYYHGFGAEHGADLFRFRDCVRSGLGSIKAFLRKKAVYVRVNNQPARVLGHIGMVQTICDVTDIPCKVGDPIRIEINPLMLKGLDILETED